MCLRGGQEQQDLKPSQFRCEHDPDWYVYVENGSKNHPGTFGQKESENKVVTIFKNEKAGQRCPVFLLDIYFKKFPHPPSEIEYFYLRPLPSMPLDDSKLWFSSVPIGKNTLAKFVEQMCKDAEPPKRTNYSL